MKVYSPLVGWSRWSVLWRDLDILNPAIRHRDDAIAKRINPAIVSDHNHSAIRLHGHLANHLHHRAAVGRIQRGGRLISDQQAWFVNESPSDRDALLLTARELARVRFQAAAQTNCHQQLRGLGHGL
jgi:hypothetical protein